jgi:hypothetical protein
MPENKYIKKVIRKDGSVKIYEYTQDWEKYHQNKKEHHQKINCPICNSSVQPWYLAKHQRTNKCMSSIKKIDEIVIPFSGENL